MVVVESRMVMYSRSKKNRGGMKRIWNMEKGTMPKRKERNRREQMPCIRAKLSKGCWSLQSNISGECPVIFITFLGHQRESTVYHRACGLFYLRTRLVLSVNRVLLLRVYKMSLMCLKEPQISFRCMKSKFKQLCISFGY